MSQLTNMTTSNHTLLCNETSLNLRKWVRHPVRGWLSSAWHAIFHGQSRHLGSLTHVSLKQTFPWGGSLGWKRGRAPWLRRPCAFFSLSLQNTRHSGLTEKQSIVDSSNGHLQSTNVSLASPKLRFSPTPVTSHALMALEQECAAFPSADVPHDDAVVRGSWKEQPLDRVPPEAGDATWGWEGDRGGVLTITAHWDTHIWQLRLNWHRLSLSVKLYLCCTKAHSMLYHESQRRHCTFMIQSCKVRMFSCISNWMQRCLKKFFLVLYHKTMNSYTWRVSLVKAFEKIAVNI